MDLPVQVLYITAALQFYEASSSLPCLLPISDAAVLPSPSNCRCEPKLAGLAEFSEHPAVIITAYLIVIFPWRIKQKVDFISEKWRTIMHTRHLAYIHLTLSVIPLPYIIFYAHLQQISSDYKEMMAAVVVILMAIYHIGRTI